MPKAKTGACRPRSRSGSQLEFPLHPAETDVPEDAADAPPGDVSGAAPTFSMVRESGIDGEKRCLYLMVTSTEGETFRLDFTPGCIPLAAGALLGELGFLHRHQPDLNEAVQPIVIDGCQLGETASGAPALLARMEGGGELPLQMSLTDLRQLSQQIENYICNRAANRRKR